MFVCFGVCDNNRFTSTPQSGHLIRGSTTAAAPDELALDMAFVEELAAEDGTESGGEGRDRKRRSGGGGDILRAGKDAERLDGGDGEAETAGRARDLECVGRGVGNERS